MIRILVADKLADDGLARLRSAAGVSVDVRTGLSPGELAELVADYDGMLIRSGVKVTAEVLAKPGRLRVVARAGVGVDNVDLAAATRAGVLVINTPDANTLSTAEQTFALMLALARHTPAACADLKSGRWNRAQFEGTQLAGKTLGILGLGRVGRAVATRALAFEMNVLAHDPFVSDATAMGGRIRLLPTVEELIAAADFLTIHAVMSDATRGLIGAAQLAAARPGLRIINCARGGIVDERALADAIRAGRVAGAALDVFEQEPPPADSPLLGLPQVVCTPHLGASTIEAQQAVSIEAVDALLDFLLRGQVRGACNLVGLPSRMSERDLAAADLVSRLGAVLSAFCDRGVSNVTLTTYGTALETVAPALQRFALASLLGPFVSDRLNVVNVDSVVRQRGISIQHLSEPESRGTTDRVRLAVDGGGVRHQIEGGLDGDGLPRLLAIDGYPMNIVPEGTLLLIFNDDRPGVIGLVGTTLGNLEINIADMALSRHANRALMVLKLDAPPPDQALAALSGSDSILSVRLVNLTGVTP